MARKKSLTENMEKFAISYLANKGNVQETAKQVGVSSKTAYSYMKNELVSQEITRLMSLAPVETVRNAVQLQEHLNDLLSDDYKDEVLNFRTGEIVHIKPRLVDKVKAIELLGKFGGHFVQKHEVTQTRFVIDVIDDDEEHDIYIDAEWEEV